MTVLGVAVIGAGPYGLSIAAHLSAWTDDFRIFGTPMQTWRHHMPAGMALKSDGFASNLSAPGAGYTLGDYCREQGLPYTDKAKPVDLQVFADYAMEFQRRLVPGLEPGELIALDRDPQGFRLRFDTGVEVVAAQVVLAIGILPFSHIPVELATLPTDLCSHSLAHRRFEAFRGKDVTVIGAGASAVDVAVALQEAGARTRLLARAGSVKFGSEPGGKPRGRLSALWQQIRHPSSGLGPGLRSRAFCEFPDLFRLLPTVLRHRIVARHLGPKSPWALKSRFVGKVEVVTGRHLRGAEASGGRVTLKLGGADGTLRQITTDHVIAATGYRVDLARLGFLSGDLRAALRAVEGIPELSSGFETSVPGLYMAGTAAAGSFGPLMRFMYGADFAARRIARRVAGRMASKATSRTTGKGAGQMAGSTPDQRAAGLAPPSSRHG